MNINAQNESTYAARGTGFAFLVDPQLLHTVHFYIAMVQINIVITNSNITITLIMILLLKTEM